MWIEIDKLNDSLFIIIFLVVVLFGTLTETSKTDSRKVDNGH